MKLIGILTVISMTIALVFGSSGTEQSALKNAFAEMMDMIGKKYDSNFAPTTFNETTRSDNPVVVKVNTFVRSMSVDSKNREMKVILTFRNEWQDSRLKYDDRAGKVGYVNLPIDAKVWKPDIFFSNEIEASFHNMLLPNTLMRVYPDGTILSSTRISLKLSCPMDLRLFPSDTQVCQIILASYGFTTKDLVLLWKESDPLQVTKSLYMPSFSLVSYNTEDCTSKTITGEYSCLKASFTLKRESGFMLTEVYIPMTMFILVGYLAFWLSSKQATAKVLISALALLSAAAICSYTTKEFAGETPYTTALRCWLGICMTFLFIGLVESVMVCWLVGDKKESDEFEFTEKNKIKMLLKKFSPKAHPLDMAFRILYPVVFFLYNFVFFASLGDSSE